MLGAIFGDIVGSSYEWNNVKTKDFPLERPGTRYTDDSVMTLAVAKWLLEDPYSCSRKRRRQQSANSLQPHSS